MKMYLHDREKKVIKSINNPFLLMIYSEYHSKQKEAVLILNDLPLGPQLRSAHINWKKIDIFIFL